MTEIDATVSPFADPQAPEVPEEVPVLEAGDEAQAPEETPGDEQPQGEAEQNEQPPEPPQWSKPLQKAQQEIANLRKQLEALTGTLKTTAKPETPAQTTARLAKVKAFLTGDKRKELDTYMPGMGDVLEELAADLETARGPAPHEEVEKLRKELEYDRFFAKYPPNYREAFEAQQQVFEEEEGLTGPALQGAMTVWFKQYVAAKATKAKETGTPARAASGSGAARVIPSTTGPRRTAAPDPKKILESGRGGNIGGISFRP